MKHPCKEETLLSAYLDGELTEPEREAVACHLENCAQCARAVATLQQADKMVQGIPDLEPSTDFDRNFWQKVEALDQKRSRRSWLGSIFSGWRPVLAGGLAGIVAVVIYTSGNKDLSPEEMFIAEHMEMLENYDMIGELEMLEHWEAIEAMREQT